jgi:hypothetical protein
VSCQIIAFKRECRELFDIGLIGHYHIIANINLFDGVMVIKIKLHFMDVKLSYILI